MFLKETSSSVICGYRVGIYHLYHKPDIDRLEEAIAMCFPAGINERNRDIWDKHSPREWIEKTEIHLYIPISAHIGDIPKELRGSLKPFMFPNNDRIKIFFYDIPCDRLGKNAVQILYGARDATTAYQEYLGVIKKGISFPELKYRLSKTRFRAIDLSARGFGNTIDAIKFHGSASFPAISSFLNRLNAFTDEGILNTSESKHSLPKVFARNKEWEKQNAIVLLYSGFINEEYLRIFNLVNFIETQWKFMSAVKHKINFKSVDYINEAGVLFPRQKDKYYRGVHQALTSFAKWLIPQSRHAFIELWLDSQHFDMLDESIRTQIRKNLVTRYHDDNAIERFSSILSVEKNLLRRTWNEWSEKGIYRFFDTSLPVNVWEDAQNKLQLGFELPRPKLSFDGKISFKEFDDCEDFRGVCKDYQLMLSEGEKFMIKRIKDERAKAKKAKEKEDMTHIRATKAIVAKLGVDLDDVKKMDRDSLNGLIDRIRHEVANEHGIEVSAYTVKRALNLWRT